MCHTRIRAKNTTDKTFECHTMTDNKKNSVLIAVQYLAFYESGFSRTGVLCAGGISAPATHLGGISLASSALPALRQAL